jgi:D-serine deaminase-like pyridoxal phosphate-dependent protein
VIVPGIADDELRRELIRAGKTSGLRRLDAARAGFEFDPVTQASLDKAAEVQAGSYVFMDNGYRAIGGRTGDSDYHDFLSSLTVLTTVVSASTPDRVTVDAGIKAFATDSGGKPRSKDREGLDYQFGGDEFGRITARRRAARAGRPPGILRDALRCDPTVNRYDRIYAVRGDAVEAVWPVVARRG